jgi:hypothetical protein
MDRDLLGGILVAVGAVLVVLSLLADPIGIGTSDGFGWQQILGVLVGALATLVGLAVVALRDRGWIRHAQPHH